jgi:recombination protein U
LGRNKGELLERLIEVSANQYELQGKAIIKKIEVKKKADKSRGSKQGIKYMKKSTVDFNGVIEGGRHVAFEAKEVTAGTNWAYTRLEPHQRRHLENVARLGGHAFVIVYFKLAQEMYLLTIQEIEHLENTLTSQNGKPRKSVPLQWFRDNRDQIKSRHGVAFDFLSHL